MLSYTVCLLRWKELKYIRITADFVHTNSSSDSMPRSRRAARRSSSYTRFAMLCCARKTALHRGVLLPARKVWWVLPQIFPFGVFCAELNHKEKK